VGYPELLKALDDEVERQIRQIEVDAEAACQQLQADTRRDLEGRRDAALADEERRLAEHARQLIARARFEQARALLVEQRRLLDDIRHEAERRLAELDDAGLAARFVDEIAPELGDGAVEFRVSPGQEEGFVAALSRRHPALAHRATVIGVEGLGGGVVAVLDGGRQLLDSSLPSRLEKAWQQMEGELSAQLFGDFANGSRL
jgi:vacuolar-type H+-ATPase subunit E/Vma4